MLKAIRAVALVVLGVSTAFATEPPTDVSWYYDNSTVTAGVPVQFRSYAAGSTEGRTYLWDFGDNTTSTEAAPLHTYAAADDHRVSLTVTNNFGSGNDTSNISVSPATGGQPPSEATFEWNPVYPVTGQEVQFRDRSTGSIKRWRWDFEAVLGDTQGADSILQDPKHTFTSTGQKNVQLFVSNAYGRKAVIIFVNVFRNDEPLLANFDWTPFNVVAAQPMQFRDLSNGATSWTWDFGDGSTGTEQNPVHVYDNDGQKTVTLTVSGPGGTDTDSKQFACHSTTQQGLAAKFTWMPVPPRAGEAMQLIDQSLGLPDSWSWTLGDGTQSTQRNFTHTFTQPGNYEVTLRVTKGTTTNQILRTVQVLPSPLPPLTAPSGLVATASGTSQVAVTWSGVPNALNYEVFRSANNTPYALHTTSPNTSFTDTSVVANKTYLYKVRATGNAPTSPFSAIDAATTTTFTNNPLTAGVMIRAAHITQLRTAVNAMRAAGGLTAATFTNHPLTVGTPIRAVHLEELRTALAQARSAIGLTAFTPTDPTLVPGSTKVRAIHIQELRNAVR